MTKKLGVIGFPISHSFSPKMHNFISKEMGLDYCYDAFEIAPFELFERVEDLKKTGICGFNVTAPHKIEIIQNLDFVSEDARRFGSVNTVVFKDGKWCGFNTDAEGFYLSLKYYGICPEKMDILVFGAGGAAQPSVMYMARKSPKSITVINRTQQKSEKLAELIEADSGYKIQTSAKLAHYDLVINCTSLGMGNNSELSPVYEMPFADERTSVVDMIYNPEKTVFLKLAEEKGARIHNGLAMLIYQGILAYELFTDVKLPQNMADRIFKEVFGR